MKKNVDCYVISSPTTTFAEVVNVLRCFSSVKDEEVLSIIGEEWVVLLPVATHALGGRTVFLSEAGMSFQGRRVGRYVPDTERDGWDLLEEGDLDSVEFFSYTSRSSIRAARGWNGGWVVTLEVPALRNKMKEYEPYKGSYWGAFYEVFPDAEYPEERFEEEEEVEEAA